MNNLKNEYNCFRERIFCQDIDYNQIKHFSDKVKQQLGSNTSERYHFEVISLLHKMLNHNQSINTGAAPTIDTLHLFDLSLSLNQLQSLKRCIQKLEYPSEILDALSFLYDLLRQNTIKPNKLFFMNCKIINDVLFHYKKTLKVKNLEYQQRSLEQIELLIEYGKKNNSSILIENLISNQIDEQIKTLYETEEASMQIKDKCDVILNTYFKQNQNK